MIKHKMVGAVSSGLPGAICPGQLGAILSDQMGALCAEFPFLSYIKIFLFGLYSLKKVV
jgi:hypothetical protein